MNEILIVSGSQRAESQSAKVARYLQKEIQLNFKELSAEVLDLGKTPLPFWDEGVWEKTEKWTNAWSPIQKNVAKSMGIIVVSPEWSGMVPPALKNFFLLCSGSDLAHKPGLIVSVSAGTGGAYPVAELRMSSYKNTKINYIPDHVIIRDVENVLNESEEALSKSDTWIRGRIDYSLQVFQQYVFALKQVRESGVTVSKNYSFGM